MKLETRVGLFIVGAFGVFLYLSINIRAFRFDKNDYNEYKAYFDDTGGVTTKSSVRIAGVEVGWVEAVKLLQGGHAELTMRVHRKNKLAKNAYCMIHQDGLIGSKTVEIDPGDPTTGFLIPGSILAMPGKTPTSIGELMDQFRGIASSIQDITNSVKSVIASRKSERAIKKAISHLADASTNMADFSLGLKNTLAHNRDNIDQTMASLSEFSKNIKDTLDKNKASIDDIIYNTKTSIEEINKSIPKVTDSIDKTATSLTSASKEVTDTFKEAKEIATKINTGKGFVGKIINEEDTYNDLKKTVHGFRKMVDKSQKILIDIDMHSENMLKDNNNKGYFSLRIRPYSDYFYTLQLVSDEFGTIKREIINTVRKDEFGNRLRPSLENISMAKKIEFADKIEREIQTKYDTLFSLQFGKRFERLVFRIGLFENTFGVGIDYYIPLKTKSVHWITTLEAFDFKGQNRINDNRPHIKWLNRTFFMKNFYTTFGMSNICSKRNSSPFWGAGLRFGDDDLKYIISSVAGQIKK